MKSSILTVENLRYLIADWPSHGPKGQPTQILLAPSYPDCSLGLEPVVVAGTTEDGGLCLYPEQREIPTGSLAANASPLEIAAAALRYQLVTAFSEYDPEIANQLFHRAVVAIEQSQGARTRTFDGTGNTVNRAYTSANNRVLLYGEADARD